jgi:hypothetical protein
MALLQTTNQGLTVAKPVVKRRFRLFRHKQSLRARLCFETGNSQRNSENICKAISSQTFSWPAH